MSDHTGTFYRVDHLDDSATDEQLQRLRETLETLLDVQVLMDEAHKVRDEYFDQCCLRDDTERLNQDLQWEIEDMIYEHLQTYIDYGFLPETDGDAHDVVSEVVAEHATELLKDVRITEEDIYIAERRIQEEPDPDRLYEARKEKEISQHLNG